MFMGSEFNFTIYGNFVNVFVGVRILMGWFRMGFNWFSKPPVPDNLLLLKPKDCLLWNQCGIWRAKPK